MLNFKTQLCLVISTLGSMSLAMADNTHPNIQPDNSAVNARDHSADAKTADHQATTDASSKNDVELTRMIRRDLTKDNSLSTYAKNVKIITQNGEVTLRGPIRTAVENSRIETIAKKIAGNNKVHNELEIKQ